MLRFHPYYIDQYMCTCRCKGGFWSKFMPQASSRAHLTSLKLPTLTYLLTIGGAYLYCVLRTAEHILTAPFPSAIDLILQFLQALLQHKHVEPAAKVCLPLTSCTCQPLAYLHAAPGRRHPALGNPNPLLVRPRTALALHRPLSITSRPKRRDRRHHAKMEDGHNNKPKLLGRHSKVVTRV